MPGRSPELVFRSRIWALRRWTLGLAFFAALTLQGAAAQSTVTAPPAEPTAAERMARALGHEQSALVNWVLDHSGPVNGIAFAGAYRLAYTITPAEAWWDNAGNGDLAWHDAPASNVHLRIFVLDRADGRLVDNLNLRVTLTDARGNSQPVAIAYGWYPLVNAYGGNIPIETDGSYTLRVAVVADTALDLHAPHTPPATDTPDEHLERITVADFAPVAISIEEISHLPLATATAAAAEPELLKPFNAALADAITAWWKQSACGAEKPAGDYFVAYALADPSQFGGRLRNLLDFSSKDNASLTLVVRDSRTGRILPGLHPKAALDGGDAGSAVGPELLAAAWHPWLTVYADQLRIRGRERYRLEVSFDAPGYRRWGKESQRFGAPVEIAFDDVSLKEGSASEQGSPKGKPTP